VIGAFPAAVRWIVDDVTVGVGLGLDDAEPVGVGVGEGLDEGGGVGGAGRSWHAVAPDA
jgi:hypothetical protein